MDALVPFLEKLPQLITSFASLGVGGWIAGGVFAILISGGLIWIYKWVQGKKIAAAGQKTESSRVENQSDLSGQTSELEDNALSALERLKKKISERMKK